jgi:hypothetical protein
VLFNINNGVNPFIKYYIPETVIVDIIERFRKPGLDKVEG